MMSGTHGYGLGLHLSFTNVSLVMFQSSMSEPHIYVQDESSQYMIWVDFNTGDYKRFDLRLL